MTQPMALSGWFALWPLYRLPLAVAIGSALYYLAVIVASLRFRSERKPHPVFTPPVSILKPLKGVDPNFYECLASHCRQSYPQFEIIFGLCDPRDSATATIAQLQRDFPQVPIKLVIVPESHGANRKMNSLARMLPQAAHDFIVINDADIRVEPDYLRSVIAPLGDESVGLVTCLYRGVPAGGFASILEALGLSGDFAGQVLLARWVEGVKFALGATMATRQKQIAAIGGLERWTDYLADDYVLGSQIVAAGYRIHLSHNVVDTMLPNRSFAELLRQQVRWARTVRCSRPGGYPGLLLTFGVPFALLALLAHPGSALAGLVFAVTLAVRLLAAWTSGVMVAGDRTLRRFLWLLPVRDALGLGVWIASYLGSTVVWRGEQFRIEKGGRIRQM